MIEKKVYYHNGTEYVEISNLSIIDGLTIEETIDDTLDSATLIIKNEFESFLELWSSVKIVSGALTKCFLVSDIFSKRESDIQVKYQHTISLIEPTKYLEKIYCSSMSFTNKSDNLLQQLEKALINAEVLDINSSPRFKLSNALKDRLANEPSKDFFFEKSTLREILDGMLGALDLRCEVYEITDFNNITIDFYDRNARNSLIEIGEILDKSSVENLEFLGSDIESYAENAFSGSRSSIYHPSPNGWDTFKTNEATLTTENAVISTTFPIEQLDEFIIQKVKLLLNFGGQTNATDVSNIDISTNVVDEETYKILPSTTNNELIFRSNTFYKENTIYYRRGEEEIQFENRKRLIFFVANNLEGAIINALFRQGSPGGEAIYTGLAPATILEQIMFRIKYIPYINAHTRISKTNYSKVPSTIIDNQDDKVIDLERYGDNLSSTINRLGNKLLTIDKTHNSMNETFKVQDYTADNYVLTKKTIALYNYIIKAHYEFTKDFYSVNERIGIDRAKKIYNIPLENFVRDILIKEYIVASFDGTEISSDAISLFMKVFSPSSEKLPITNALVRTEFVSLGYMWQATTTKTSYVAEGESGDNPASPIYLPPANNYQLGDYGRVKFNVPPEISPEGYYYQYYEVVLAEGVSDWLELSVAPYVMATSLHFRFRFQDNFSAGMSIEHQVIGGKKATPNPYVNSYGEHNKIRLILLNDKLATRSELYDDIKLLPKTNLSWYNNALKLVDSTYQIFKDAFEYMQYVYQLEVVSSDPNIIIGSAIAKLNPMVADIDYSLYLYTSINVKYSKNDLKAKEGLLHDITWSYENNRLILFENEYPYNPVSFSSSVKSWCLADNLGNILVAVNKVGENIINNSVRFNYKVSRN